MNKIKPKWKKFEINTHKVIQSLHPQEQTYQNVFIDGKLSKVKRQVDVQVVNPSDYEFIAFECKDYRKVLDVVIVEAFSTKLKDIGAKKGAIVSNSPFSEAAQNMASALDIDLLNLVNTSDKDIHTKLFASVLLSDTMVKSMHVVVETQSLGASIPPSVKDLIFMNEVGVKGTAYQIFAALWNEAGSSLIKKPGLYGYQPPNPSGKRLIGPDGRIWVPSKIEYIYEVVEKHFAGQIELIETQGLYDVKTHGFQTRSIQTVPMVAYDLEMTWPEISVEEATKNQSEGKYTMSMSCTSVLPEESPIHG